MAVYLSRNGSHRIVMIPKDYGERKIGKHSFSRVLPGLSVKFRKLTQGIPNDRLPLRAGVKEAFGIFRTDVDFPTREAAVYDVTEEELIEFLDTHPENVDSGEPGGKSFVRVDQMETQVLPEGSFLQDTSEGIWCKLCERLVDRRGIQGHVNGNQHKELLAGKEQEVLSA